MTMDKETQNNLIGQFLDDTAAEFDRIVAEGEGRRHRKVVLRTALLGAAAVAAGFALFLRPSPANPTADSPLTPVQIAEGIRQMMLLDIGEINSIVATPEGSCAILTAYLKDGSTCSYILKCNDAEGITTLLAYTNNK